MTACPTMPSRIHRLLKMLVAGAVLALATACGGSAPSAPPAPPPVAPSSTPAAPARAATTVNVRMTEFKLALDKSALAPGAYTFHAVNTGQAMHALAIEGAGIQEQRTALVGPGKSVDLSVTLPAGSFDLYCPVDNHKGMGMTLALKVK